MNSAILDTVDGLVNEITREAVISDKSDIDLIKLDGDDIKDVIDSESSTVVRNNIKGK